MNPAGGDLVVSTIPLAPGRARREIVRHLRRRGHEAPAIVPTSARGVFTVTVGVDPREVVRELATLAREHPGAPPLDAGGIIREVAESIDARVNLSRPDKVLLVQVFDDRVALSIVAASEVFSVVKALGARARAA
jgi:tRNA(Ser,Leu) C12 N-acetylase TAN1